MEVGEASTLAMAEVAAASDLPFIPAPRTLTEGGDRYNELVCEKTREPP